MAQALGLFGSQPLLLSAKNTRVIISVYLSRNVGCCKALPFSIVELPAAMYYRDPYRDRLRHGWTCRVLNGEVEVAIDVPVVQRIWRLQHLRPV